MVTAIYALDGADFEKVGEVETSNLAPGSEVEGAIRTRIEQLIEAGRTGPGQFITASPYIARRFRAERTGVKVTKL
jgi:hypothetical protein